MSLQASLKDCAKTFVAKTLPDSEVELVGEIPFETLAPYRQRAVKHLAEHMELPGFRPGKVPMDMALKKVGEQATLEEAVELLVKDFYPTLIEEQKLDAVGRPDIRVTKLASGNPVGLTIRATVYPEVTLPKNWKGLADKIAAELPMPATEEEVQKTLEDLQKSRKAEKLDDEFAKSVGAFENVEHLKTQIHKGITEEKQRATKDARRGKLVEALLKDTKVEVPKLFVESELEKIMAQMREDITRMGMEFDAYLKHANKTEADIRKDFAEQAAKRAKLQLALNKIAIVEQVDAEPTAVEHEMKHALEHFPDANPELLGIHIQTVLKNELVLKMLEGEVANHPLKQ